MKLKLTSNDSVESLQIIPPMEDRDIQVLRACVAKLVRAGKSRILIDVSGVNPLPKGIIKELEELHAVATELAGVVALAGVQPPAPPTGKLPVFPKADEALRFLRGGAPARKAPAPAGAPEAKPAAAAPAPAPSSEKKPASAVSPDDARKARIQHEQGELGRVRAELEQMRLENSALLKRLSDILVERKHNAGLDELKKRVDELEAELAQKA